MNLSPTFTASSTAESRLPRPSFEMWTRPSRPGRMLTKAPNVVVFTTVPSYRSPTSGSRGFTIASIISRALSAPEPSRDPMNTRPSSSMSMSAPVRAMISLIRLPFGPMTSPILSTGMVKATILGAYGESSGRGAGSVSAILPRM